MGTLSLDMYFYDCFAVCLFKYLNYHFYLWSCMVKVCLVICGLFICMSDIELSTCLLGRVGGNCFAGSEELFLLSTMSWVSLEILLISFHRYSVSVECLPSFVTQASVLCMPILPTFYSSFTSQQCLLRFCLTYCLWRKYSCWGCVILTSFSQHLSTGIRLFSLEYVEYGSFFFFCN